MDTIDILMATYNGEQYLKDQLESIEKQTYDNWHLIIRDDGSKDRTKQILLNFKKKFPDKVTLIDDDHPSGCAKKNFFKLFQYSTNKYISCCDQDDIWVENKIEIMYQEIKKLESGYSNKVPLLVYSDLYVVDQGMNIISNSFFDYSLFNKNASAVNNFLIENYVTGCAMMFNECLKNYMLKNYNLEKIIMHDWLAALIAYCFGKAKYIDKPLVKYRQHGDNSVGANSPKKISNLISNAKKGFKFAKKVVTNTYDQVEEFYLVNKFEVDSHNLKVVIEYAKLKNKSKLERLSFYKNNGIKKIGLVRKIWLIVFG